MQGCAWWRQITSDWVLSFDPLLTEFWVWVISAFLQILFQFHIKSSQKVAFWYLSVQREKHLQRNFIRKQEDLAIFHDFWGNVAHIQNSHFWSSAPDFGSLHTKYKLRENSKCLEGVKTQNWNWGYFSHLPRKVALDPQAHYNSLGAPFTSDKCCCVFTRDPCGRIIEIPFVIELNFPGNQYSGSGLFKFVFASWLCRSFFSIPRVVFEMCGFWNEAIWIRRAPLYIPLYCFTEEHCCARNSLFQMAGRGGVMLWVGRRAARVLCCKGREKGVQDCNQPLVLSNDGHVLNLGLIHTETVHA